MDEALYHYILGYVAGDGCVYRDKKKLYLDIASTDLDHLADIHAAFEGLAGNLRFFQSKRPGSAKLGRFHISNQDVVNRFIQSGLTEGKSKSGCKFKLNEDHLGQFARGYFDADGHLTVVRREHNGLEYSYPQLVWTAGHRQILVDLQEALGRKGLLIRLDVYNGIYKLRTSGSRAEEILNLMYSNINLALLRKKLLAQKWVQVQR
jgi:intein-encoded DNA endonuclease-like protein